MSGREVVDELLELKKQALRGKLKAMGVQGKALDKLTQYVYADQEMPGRLILNRFRAQCFFEWMASPPVNKRGMRIGESLVGFHESVMAGFAAVPDVTVDMEGGKWDILDSRDGSADYGLDDVPGDN